MSRTAILDKGITVLVNGVPFTLANSVETTAPFELLQYAIKVDPLDDVKLITNAMLDAQQELLKLNGSMVKQTIQGYERTEVLRTIEIITKLDIAKDKLSKLWDCFKNK